MAWSAAAAFVIGGAAGAMANKPPKLPPVQPPTPPPQASQAPSAADQRRGVLGAGQSGGSAGIAQTMLTGAGGVDDGQLKLGKNTLLGG